MEDKFKESMWYNECPNPDKKLTKMKDRIKTIIADKLGIDFSYMDGERLFDDLGFDSLDVVEMIMSLEAEYNIAIPDNDSDRWQTIDDMVKTCEEYLSAKK